VTNGDNYSVSIDYGNASAFVSGTYPQLLINPNSSNSKPGNYVITITLTDDHPKPLSSVYKLDLVVLAPASSNYSSISSDSQTVF
jgi:hypothetical protein